jgi:hypothetical protein
MSRDKLILLGAVVLGLLGFLVYKQNQKDTSLGQAVTAAKDLPTISAPDDVDKISITNGDKGEIVLQRVPDPSPAAAAASDAGPPTMWQLVKPLTAVANQQTAKDLVANLKELKADSQVNLKLDDDVRKEKQLDAAKGVHVVAWKGADKKLDEVFGKSGPAGQLVIVTSQPDVVWAAKGYSAFLYTKEAKDFRDKEIFKFDDANAAQVTVTNTHGTMSFTKGDKWAATADKAALPRFSEDKLKDMLRAYKALNADDFGDGKSLADTGLDKPEATATIQLKDNAGTYTLLVGKTSAGTSRWAKRANDDAIFQITNYNSDWVTSDESKFQLAADAGAGAAGDAGKVAAVTPPKK